MPTIRPISLPRFGRCRTVSGRVDLGLGRAPGTDMATARPCGRHEAASVRFPDDILELKAWLGPRAEGQRVIANPGIDSNVPLYIWVRASTAHISRGLGLPYAFASHFAPDQLFEAIHFYRRVSSPRTSWTSPMSWGCHGRCGGETDEEAAYYFTSAQQQFVNLRRGRPANIRRRSPTWTSTGRRWSGRWLNTRCNLRSSARRIPWASNSSASSRTRRRTRSSCRSRSSSREAAGSGEGDVGDGCVRQGMRASLAALSHLLGDSRPFLFNRTRPRFPESSTSRRNVGHSICDGALQSAT